MLFCVLMLLINHSQFERINSDSLTKSADEIAQVIWAKYGVEGENLLTLVNFNTLNSLRRYVCRIVKIGWMHKFSQRIELYNLVEGCLLALPYRLLKLPVLDHQGLDPDEKIKVMMEFLMMARKRAEKEAHNG